MQMIDSVNALSLPAGGASAGGAEGAEDPMGQIAQILSSHLESLQWIDGAVREVETKVSDTEKRIRTSDGGNAASAAGKSRYGAGAAGR